MREELDNDLCTKYPKIFVNRHGDPKETLMCWGFECRDGWHTILDLLCANIQHYIDWQNQQVGKGYSQYKTVPQLVAVQVKEKFGTLRFYTEGGDEKTDGMIRMAESMSAVTCESCGNRGQLRHGGWIRTLCDQHEAEYQEKMRERFKQET